MPVLARPRRQSRDLLLSRERLSRHSGKLRGESAGLVGGDLRERFPRDLADHPCRGCLRTGPHRADDRERAGCHDPQALRGRRTALPPGRSHAGVRAFTRHAQRDPDSEPALVDTIGQARPGRLEATGLSRVPPCAGHHLRGHAHRSRCPGRDLFSDRQSPGLGSEQGSIRLIRSSARQGVHGPCAQRRSDRA